MSTSYETHTLSFNYVRYLPERGRLRPFATVGLGVTASTSWAGWARHNVTGNFGLGTDIRLNRRLAVRVEARDFVARLPDELHGMVHSVHTSTSLVVALEGAPPTRGTFPRVEFVTEAGASFLTRGSGPSGSVMVLLPNGQTQNAVLTRRTSFSKAGRALVGLRFRVTEKNALEFDWSYSPNRYELTGSLDLPGYGDVVPDQLTQWLNIGALNYVRYLPRLGKWQPFVTAGPGLARFSGLTLDANRWGGNFGAGVDVPVRSRVALRFEARDFVFGQPDPVRGITHNLVPTAGLVFQFY